MSDTVDKSRLRLIPPVDEVLTQPGLEELCAAHPNFPWTLLVRETLDRLRSGALGPIAGSREAVVDTVVAEIRASAQVLKRGMQPVINATGVILHTNLGRALLGTPVLEAATAAMARYVDLEVDLASGQRSRRAIVLKRLLCLATGAESAMVVNNNAAAVYLVAGSASPPGRVIVSRGELVEIGGSFRLPDILDRAAAEVIEIGTTNRTYAKDYAKVARQGDVLFRAHPSNYDIKGFTHEATLAELVAVARDSGAYVAYDLGSGSLFDFARAGVEGEASLGEVVASGVDCVTMSGDKLLGGMQAGIVLGTDKFLDKMRQNPLRRAVRVDKVTIAAMQSLLQTYLFDETPQVSVPTLRMACETNDALRARAQAIVDALTGAFDVTVSDDNAALGGGSFATAELPSVALVVRCDDDSAATALAARLRTFDTPVVARVKGREVRFNMRTVQVDEDKQLASALSACLKA